MNDSLVRAITNASRLEAEHDNGNIAKTQTKATSNEPSSQGTSSGDGPRGQDTIEDTSAHTSVITSSVDKALDKEDTTKQRRIDEIDVDEDIALVSTHEDVTHDDEGINNVGEEEVVKLVTTAKMIIDTVVDDAQVTTAIANVPISATETIVTIALTITTESTKINIEKVLDLDDELKRTKTAQQTRIDGLDRRVKKLTKKYRSRTHKHKRLYKVGLTARVISSSDDEALDKEDTSKQGRIDEINTYEYIALISTHDDVIVQDEGIEDVCEEEVVEVVTHAKMLIDTIVDVAQVTTAIADILVSKRKGVMIQEPEEIKTTKTASSQQPQVHDKGKRKAKLIEEPETPKKRKHQIRVDEEFAKKLQAKLDEENRIAIEKAKQIKEKRRKFFAAKRAEEKRNKPATKAQQRSLMCTYLKNIDGWKLKALKNKSFAEIQELFDKAMKWINNFIDFRTKLLEESTKKDESETVQESSSKREGDELEQERSKKQKVEDVKESEELNKCLKIIPDDGDDVTIDATTLSIKTPIRVRDKLEQERSKKQKVDDDKEFEELKKCLEIIPDDGDDVTIDATSLSVKTPIVDYKIYKEGKKNYF
uniref:Uncharacterized protein n=1 Tax=Tanacetum cinerariifolium TaxID=118510 RepID=A0A6L2KA15_TANCI|nr:hypothetical protein [Tanacetum cinerariifolium]